MKNIFTSSEEEKNRIRNLHEMEGENKKIDSSLNDETVTNIISEGPLDGRGVIARLCCSDFNLGYWQTNPTPAVITAANGNQGAMYINHNKMTINGNTPQPGDYFKAIESEGGSPTGNDPNGKSSGLIYKVTSVSGWDLGTTYNFPGASGCPNCPGISSWSCQVSGNQGTCTEVPGSNAPYATEQDCLTSGDPNCIGQGNSYFCHNGNCYQQQGTGGQYPDLPTCQAACGHEPDKWKCTSNYQCIQDPNGPYTTQQDCQQNCGEPDYSYDCNIAMGQCNQVPGGGGQYATLAICQQNCEYDGKWTCKEYDTRADLPVGLKDLAQELGESNHFNPMPSTGWHCVKDPNGIHNTQAACQAQCPPRDEKIDCVDCEQGVMTQVIAPDTCPHGFVSVTDLTHGPCVQCDNNVCTSCGWCYGTSPMTFNSMGDCQASPNCSAGGYECISPGNCQQTTTGTFPTQAACLASPGCQGPMYWECDPGNGCSQTQNGTHPDQTTCETACCQDVINNWNWAQGSMNNPCNKFYNLFHNNPPTTFDDQCKFDYLYNMVLNLPGANPCVQGNFIDVLDGYMGLNGQGTGNVGCYGNPNSGGVQGSPALYNSVCGKIIQFGNATPMTASKYFKWQYAIDFAVTNGCVC